MKKVIFAVCFAASVPVFACSAPENKPEIPDPSTSVTAQMVKVNNQVKEYVQAKEAYLSCANLSTRELRRAERELVAYAEEFNQAVREFRLASN